METATRHQLPRETENSRWKFFYQRAHEIERRCVGTRAVMLAWTERDIAAAASIPIFGGRAVDSNDILSRKKRKAKERK